MQALFFVLLLAQTVHAQGTSPATIVVGLAVGIFIVVWLILCCRGGGGDGPASHPAARARAAAVVPAPAPAVPAPPSRPLHAALQVEDDEPLPVYVPRTISPPPPALSPIPLRSGTTPATAALTGARTSSIVETLPVDGTTPPAATRSPPPQYARVERRSSNGGV
ncbi:hypothetical protein EXIGLDRAFT_219492 [Exidia glandulosa HHB12029]|uniref:Uncharacterized protein n=1 Tax=Exidia glandulosa HHB12029 TaxID=1314781 RepID=A0A165ECU0_EXIGL|nr:hypothetical protein EXIGLDRAFT_219492 [Exidia glandulosa HHB12029]